MSLGSSAPEMRKRMIKKSRLLIAGIALAGMAQAFASGPDFYPDIKVSGKNLEGWHTLGSAQWHAENGEIVGTPGASGGGWLVFDKSYQDINFYMQYRCSDGCATGLLMRAEKTPDGGMKGVFVSLGESANDMENGNTYDVILDPQGKIVSRDGGAARQRLRPHHYAVASQAGSPRPPLIPPVRPERAGGGARRGRRHPVHSGRHSLPAERLEQL